MARRSGPGRPSKGDRHLFATRLPRPVADSVQARSDELGLSYSEYIAWILANAHGFTEPMPPGTATRSEQARLPILESKASGAELPLTG